MLLYHVGISGGKDSTALLLWAIHQSGIPRESLRVSFCDTKNEDPLTYAHLQLLEDSVIKPAGVPGGLERLEPKRGFFDLALHKHRFPSRRAQFCTQVLKLDPTRAWLRARWAEGHDVVVINGKRIGESDQRRKSMEGKPVRAFSDFWGCEEWAPLTDWTLEQVFAIHREHGVPLNPLYALGARRVGCFPCINCGKTEIRLLAKHRPEKVAQIREWEAAFETQYGRPSTFFASKTATAAFRTKVFTDDEGKTHHVAPIDEVVRWAHTTRGGSQFRLELNDEPVTCALGQLSCE